jgi:hypothetical protein
MNTLPHRSFSRPFPWKVLLTVVLSGWLGGLLLLDTVIMPSLYQAGMMTSPDFAPAGSLLFTVFNRVELLCAAIAVVSVVAIAYLHRWSAHFQRIVLLLVMTLFAIAMTQTYGLTPQMVSLGAALNWPDTVTEIPTAMTQLHGSYFTLDILKFSLGAALLGFACRDRAEMAN